MSNRVELIVVVIPLSANTVKHNIEKINKHVAVSKTKTNLETEEDQVSWQYEIVSCSSWESKLIRNYHTLQTESIDSVSSLRTLNQKKRQKGQFLGLWRPTDHKGRLLHGPSRNTTQSLCQGLASSPQLHALKFIWRQATWLYSLPKLPPSHNNVYQLKFSSEMLPTLCLPS